MSRTIPGLHHVTAISGPAQPNVDFFTRVLGQRLVKKTVNFDDPGTYHLYYGDTDGNPGTIMTFFPFAHAAIGRAGPGMARAYAYAVPDGQFDAWVARLMDEAIPFDGPDIRFGARVITLHDPDGAPVELVETSQAGQTPTDGFHSATLWEADIAPTARLLTDVFGYEELGHEAGQGAERLRLKAPGAARGAVIDLYRADTAPTGRQGAGSIHHIAFRAENDAIQLEWREKLASNGHGVTPVTDRQYFNAIYFREPGGVLFEIATDPPGFAVDEPADTMGSALMLPPQYEADRDQIEATLPKLSVPA